MKCLRLQFACQWMGMVLLAVSLAACSSSNDSNDSGVDPQDADAGASGDEGDVDVVNRVLTWSSRVEVDQEQAGIQLDIEVMPDGQNFAIAYYKETDEVGRCEEPILGETATDVIIEQIRYAWSDGDNWQHEDVDKISSVMLTGISLAFDGANAMIAYLGGTPLGGRQVCGGTDATVAVRSAASTWTVSAAVAVSNEASAGGDCPKMQNICDFGDVVGLWSTLAKAPNGNIGLIYRDIHNGYTKDADDSSDLEIAFNNGGGWSAEWIDLARGAADFPVLVFDQNNEPATAYYNGEFGMINFAKQPWADYTQPTDCVTNDDCPLGQACGSGDCICQTDAQCEAPRRCLGDRCSVVIDTMDSGLPEKSITMAVGPDGRYLVAYFDIDQKNLMFAHSVDGLSWEKSLIDSTASTGMYPSIIVDPQSGMPGIAYYRCSDYSPSELQCNQNQDGLLYAYFTGKYPDELSTQAKWKRSVISEDPGAFDGMQASAAVLPDGRIGVGYLLSWFDQSEGITKHVLMFRLGTWQ